MRKLLMALIVLVVIGTAGVWIYQNFFQQAADPLPDREEATIERGTLLATVNATGMILPEKQTTLSFQGPGRVAQVWVEEGQSVAEKEILAQLETRDLEYAIDQARLALATAQAQLLRLQRPPSEQDIAAAEAALESARASYRRLLAGPSDEEIRVARTSLDQAQASLDQAQAAYDRVADRPEIAMLPQALQLEQATIAFDAAKASFELTMRDPTEAELAAARSGIVQAEASLARLQAGVQEEDILLAQLQIEQAQLSLEQTEHQLEGSVLKAPHGGTITSVGIKQGELSGGQPAFVLTDLSQYHIEATVDEIDIGRVATGQPVTVTLDALPGELLSGEVEEIADTAQLDTGVVSYRVTIHLDPAAAPLRVGMTANVEIVTEERADILLVPNRFVRIERTTGQTYVDKLVSGMVQPMEIQTGQRDEFYSEVVAGLREGDIVVLVKLSTRDQLRQAIPMGPP
ncbi:MAG: efflux RND transporter periplasmic adaptor subunit [Anaerolineae bacterium]|nr:efflux RND transporter periplasmic adaptor subunit [Anaerolineae bacterium]